MVYSGVGTTGTTGAGAPVKISTLMHEVKTNQKKWQEKVKGARTDGAEINVSA